MRDSGDHRLSRQGHYHRPDGLNGRVRNGNGWDPVSMFAGKAHGGRSGRAGGQYGGGTTHNRCQNRLSTGFNGPILRSDAVGTNDLGVDRIPLSMEVEVGKRFIVLPPWIDRVGQVPSCAFAQETGERIGVVKRLAVRTGRLRRSLAVHFRPIDLVVFQEPSHVNVLETSS